MGAALKQIGTELHRGWRQVLLWGLAFAAISQVFLLIAVIARFGALPNYMTFYDWPGNVVRIIASTPGWRDWGPIIADEWLMEIGRMNYDYGTGVSEWSVNVIPSRLAVLFALGALVGLCLRLARRDTCDTATLRGAAVSASAGATLVAMTNVTLSWVVCCATPNWVVGLSMMGLGVSTSLALESYGPLFAGTGFALLVVTVVALGWRRSENSRTTLETRNA